MAVMVDPLRLRAITTARAIGCDGDDACVDLIHDAIVATADVKHYDESIVRNAREQVRQFQAILWAIVDESTRAGKPVRVTRVALAAYERSSKLLIEGDDPASMELLLWTDSPRSA